MALGCSVNTFGFGVGHRAALLRSIAEVGGGMYQFIETADKIGPAFADCLGGLISVAARDLVITIAPAPDVKLAAVRTHYPWRRQLAHAVVNMPDVQGGEKKTVLLELDPPKLVAPSAAQQLVQIRVDYLDVASNSRRHASAALRVSRPLRQDVKPGAIDLRVDRERNRLLVAEAIGAANDQASAGTASALEQARSTVAEAQSRVRQSPSASDPACVLLLGDLDQCLAGLRDENVYKSSGTRSMTSMQMAHACQRGSATCESTSIAYAQPARAKMVSAYKAFKTS